MRYESLGHVVLSFCAVSRASWSRGRAGARRAARATGTAAPTRADELADALDDHAHLVALGQRRRRESAGAPPQLAEAPAVADGARAEHVAGHDPRVARRVGDELGERPAHVRDEVLADQLAVDEDLGAHREEAVLVEERARARRP